LCYTPRSTFDALRPDRRSLCGQQRLHDARPVVEKVQVGRPQPRDMTALRKRESSATPICPGLRFQLIQSPNTGRQRRRIQHCARLAVSGPFQLSLQAGLAAAVAPETSCKPNFVNNKTHKSGT